MNKEQFLASALAAAMAVSMAGCGSSNSAYLKNIKASSYVTPCDYENITVEVAAPTVSDYYVEYMVSYALYSSAYEQEVTDRDDVQEGDIVDIDYVGTLDGEEFDGGSAEGYELTIGSDTFIDGFEDGLIGCTVGETVDLELTFPDDYSSEDLAGEDVVFTVTINAILETIYPELTDEWVAEQGITGVETSEEYEEYVYDYLMDDAVEDYEDELEEAISDYLIENSTYKKDPPEAMIERFVSSMTEYYESYASYYGVELDEFLVDYVGADEDDPEAIISEYAELSAKQLLVFKAISDKEGLNPNKSEWETALSTYAAYYGYDSIDDYKENEDAESVRENLMISNVLEYLKEIVTVVEPAEEEEDDDTEEEESEDEDEAEEESEEASDEEDEESSEETTGESDETDEESANEEEEEESTEAIASESEESSELDEEENVGAEEETDESSEEEEEVLEDE